MAKQRSRNAVLLRGTIKAGVATTIVVATTGIAIMLFDQNRHPGAEMSGIAGWLLFLSSPAAGIMGAVFGGLMAADRYDDRPHSEERSG